MEIRVQMKSALEAASSWSSRVRSETEATGALAVLVDRVDLGADGIRISIKLPLEPVDNRVIHATTDLSLVRMIPMQMRRRGVEVKLVIGGDHEFSRSCDPVLLKLIARAHSWFDELVTGRAASMVEIGEREKIGKRHVTTAITRSYRIGKHSALGHFA